MSMGEGVVKISAYAPPIHKMPKKAFSHTKDW